MTGPAREWTDPYIRMYTPVPTVDAGVCLTCRSGVSGPFRRCWSCNEMRRLLSRPTDRVLPISLCRNPGQLYEVLRRYKGAGPLPTERTKVAATLGRFADTHASCLERLVGGSVDLVTIVPSTSGRAEPHPLVTALRSGRRLGGLLQPLLRRSRLIAEPRTADDRLFDVLGDVSGARVLLVDDLLVSGARLQSAASALQLAGAEVGAITVGRLIEPDHCAACAEIWRSSSPRAFDFDRCGWCP